ncbi:cyclophilin-like fold protein [Parabacteroides sp. APC149_11_2_Y6]
MKYYLINIFMMLTLSAGCTSCSTDDFIPEEQLPTKPDNEDESDTNDENNSMNKNLKITIGSTSFNATLDNNATATAFKALLPITVEMPDMNSNEKYFYLSGNLPTSPSNPGTIRTGDLMLYGSSCVVLFYDTFQTSYSYTRLGHVENPSELKSALGSGNATITFELQ